MADLLKLEGSFRLCLPQIRCAVRVLARCAFRSGVVDHTSPLPTHHPFQLAIPILLLHSSCAFHLLPETRVVLGVDHIPLLSRPYDRQPGAAREVRDVRSRSRSLTTLLARGLYCAPVTHSTSRAHDTLAVYPTFTARRDQITYTR